MSGNRGSLLKRQISVALAGQRDPYPAPLFEQICQFLGHCQSKVLFLGSAGNPRCSGVPPAMARIMMAAGVAQLAGPLVALIAWPPAFTPEFGLSVAINSAFASMWLLSAWLFRRSHTAA